MGRFFCGFGGILRGAAEGGQIIALRKVGGERKAAQPGRGEASPDPRPAGSGGRARPRARGCAALPP